MKRAIIVLVLMLSVVGLVRAQTPAKPPSTPSVQDLPRYSIEQRWARAASQVTLGFIVAILNAKQTGKNADDAGKFMAATFGSGWDKTYGPMEMVRAVRRNILLYPDAKVEVPEFTAAVSRVRFDRSWAKQFAPAGELYGVKLEEVERCMEVFHKTIAEERGMTFEAKRDGDFTIYSFTKKAAT